MKGGDCYEVSSQKAVRTETIRSTQTIWSSITDWFPYVIHMKCDRPYLAPGRIAWPCGTCPSCRSTRRRVWAHRIMMEARCHGENSFVTVTYRPDVCPEELRPSDFAEWIKRLRYYVHRRDASQKIRYFGCGEYGDTTGRPHFHAAVFGIGCRLGPYRVASGGGYECGCGTCQDVKNSWSFGHTVVGTLEERSAAYIAGYVLKKMRATSDGICRHPPFVRMSLRPHGIGVDALGPVATMLSPVVLQRLGGDVPQGLRIGGSVWPLGRYLRNHLRQLVGLEEGCPEHVQEELKRKVQVVYEYADAMAKGDAKLWRAAVKQAFEEVNDQVNRNVAARNIKRSVL